MTWRIRLGLILILLGLGVVLTLAAWIHPYDAHGRPRQRGTHQQLGLNQCSFVQLTGKPCPSCGLTTSFALLMHGDLNSSLHSNAVGTLMAVFALLLMPWCVVCLLRRRLLWIRDWEWTLLLAVGTFAVLLLIRWGIVMATGAYVPVSSSQRMDAWSSGGNHVCQNAVSIGGWHPDPGGGAWV